MNNETKPLHNAHNQIDGSARIRGAEFTDEVVEFATRGADAEEERDFDEENYEGGGKTDAAEDDEEWMPEVEDVCYAQRKAQDHGKNAGPLSIDAPIPRSKLFRKRHRELL
jgi:hypothetical protein